MHEMSKPQYIQIRNAEKIFKHKIFKIRGHDFPELINKIKNKISPREGIELMKMSNNFEEKWGDYEIYIQVYPSKIKIVDMLED